MKIDTKYFGEIEIDNDKIIHFENGIMGFEEYKDFTLLYDSEAEKKPFFSWLQCVTEKSLAFPVVNPLNVIKDYNPVVEDALLEPLGELKDEDIVLLVFATIPKNVKDASVNSPQPHTGACRSAPKSGRFSCRFCRPSLLCSAKCFWFRRRHSPF